MTTTTRSKAPSWLSSFGAQVTIGLIIGVILGLVAKNFDNSLGAEETSWLSATLSWIGSTYVKLLKVMIAPLIITAVITSIANLRQVKNAARLAGQTIIWFAITAFFSVIAAIIVATVLKPGVNSSIDPAAAAEPNSTGSWLGFINSVIPTNFLGLQAWNSGENIGLGFSALQLILISIALGIAAIKAGKAAEPFLQFNESLLQIIQVILWWIIRLAPIGTAALIGNAVATYGWDAIGSLGKFVLALYVGLAIVMFVIYPVVLMANRIPVLRFFSKVWPITSLGFVTRSSMGVMPVNQQVAVKSMGVPREYASFAIPLGATTKMDGCAAVYPAIAAIFVAQFYGIDLSLTHYLLIIFVSVIGSAATAGTTGATVMLTLTLSTLGLPLAGVGLLLAVEPIIDMGRTAVNVTGQNLSTVVVAKREGILNDDIFDDDTSYEDLSAESHSRQNVAIS
ncbi:MULTISPECIES: dicarboxylate/amino acid:cation symporter [unclassified Corynebacterium]|uniref:dicarboxylate/amino acid:cation symporter n=1 Tax=unclassified Corynebacterium TaxID=2624378 RepID=UPI002167845F|nr:MULTISPECIES: dicarboxylate/amino acid:cation symporter [unclassified Corynebacterium]MCS4492187.1 dicarboxylate/amino acid:cation symporter [Corynebacterium sp. ES2715-CONJ3]MCS4532331.1 dicarboxylate/amino acid:cation symporter [Corynebacterium sp. ES2730-CONJ]